MRVKRRFAWWFASIAAIAALLFWVGEQWATQTANTVATAEASQLAVSNASLFNSELEKFRLLPVALAEYPDVAALLKDPDATTETAVNRKLEGLAQNTKAAAIYVISRDGRTLAASNYRQSTSFVGQNYAFRPYFRDAMAAGNAELFALGTVSGRPGLYLARRIGSGTAPLGVIVVKVEFDALARGWARQAGTTMVADANGIVIVSSEPGWQFRTLRTLGATVRASIAAGRQFEGAALTPLDFKVDQPEISINSETHRRHIVPVGLNGAQLVSLLSTKRAADGARAQARIVTILILFALAAVLTWEFRQAERAAMQREARRQLELEVADRTAALKAVNEELVIESAERARSEQRYREAREDLAQANRLSTLGQVTAGVAHEINQPVAAIRTFGENAVALIDLEHPERARENLLQIVGLTERIAAITGDLRGFARRKTPAVGPTRIASAVEAALLLINHRLAATTTRIAWDRSAFDVEVQADRIRLEQVFVNLIQNSIDATEVSGDGHVELTCVAAAAIVTVTVADNGPGLPEKLKPKLFTPFRTGKEHGLGLGLAIVRDIMRSFGGEVRLLEGLGARFELVFVRS